ncbi:tyrosine-type recombinase/integrase [Ruminococcus flavefaciens]|uniref:Tyr recombinase domain-containing protein n=1 Tax=Ruminococcus flavefaciens 007c TaxID=1341157 RepID=W7UNC8_RUMFL|nr:tyrosine-type recombinase/integrase [Ruminococcus flavefaciens]EWM55318.1 hypothetical protein RF007C_00070 [Ruminococcus flavefaciens 007c]
MFTSVLANEMSAYVELRKHAVSENVSELDRKNLLLLDRFMTLNNYSEKILSEDFISSWILTLTGKSKTRSEKISTVRGFVKYLHSIGMHSFMPDRIKVKSDYIPYIYNDEELAAIFKCADNLKELCKGKHNPYLELIIPMILRILYGCGTRLGETMELKRKDVDFKRGTLYLRVTKFSKERVIPMHESLIVILERYCLALGIMNDPEAFLFPSKESGTHYSARNIDSWFAKILEACNIDQHKKQLGERGACLHCFRHVFVLKSMDQLEKSGHPVDMNDLLLPTYLGHECMIDTDKYMRFSGVQSSETLDSFERFTNGLIPEVEVNYEEE